MAITNGYCTLAEARQRLLAGADLYISTGVSFNTGTKIIADSNKGLARFLTGNRVQVSGSTSNDGTYTIATGGVAAQFVTSEALGLTEIAGDVVTIADLTDPTDDAIIESVVEAVSRWIDNDTGRRFYTTAADETRYYTHDGGDRFQCPDDIVSITTLGTDDDGDRTYENTWTVTTDYDLEPYNASLDGMPYTSIRVTPTGRYGFPTVRHGVKIVGKFGLAAVPKPIKEACLLLTQRVFKRKDAVFGVFGSVQTGMVRITDFDIDAWRLLLPYVRMGAWAV